MVLFCPFLQKMSQPQYHPTMGSQDMIFSESVMNCLEQEIPGINEMMMMPETFYALNDNKQFQQYLGFKEESDSVQAAHEKIASPPVQVPTNKEFGGEYNFKVTVNPNHDAGSKNAVLYSKLMNKVFINIDQILPLEFNWTPNRSDLMVRAMLLFAAPQYAFEPVIRCQNHRSATFNKDIDPAIVHHVLRCHNTEAEYFGMDGGKDHVSVTVPLGVPQAGTQTVRILYEFACKNSCSSGMNRRAVECIFTLETKAGDILGRRNLPIRICSCPKRDKDKEEKDKIHGGVQVPSRKRQLNGNNTSIHQMAKKPKNEEPDKSLHKLSVNVVGLHNYRGALQFIFNAMAGDLFLGRNENGDIYQPHLAAVESELNSLSAATKEN